VSEGKISREEFDALWEAYRAFAAQLRERDRHERGGTTLGEIAASGEFAEALVSVLSDPALIRHEVNSRLNYWLGERDGWGGYRHESPFLADYGSPPGIAMLGKTGRFGRAFPEPHEVSARASRAERMTEVKAENRIKALEELAALCLELAEAFVERLKNEAGIRRVQ
jgi:hypothetical protein